MTISPIPALDRTSLTFKADVDAFFGLQLPAFAGEANALAADVTTKQATASGAASTATTQAGIATTKAGLTAADAAATAADRVQTGLDRASATGSASTATTQAGIATAKAGEAAASASDAATSAATATAPVAPATHAATSKSAPVDADELPLADSAATFTLKKLTWLGLKATLKTYLDGFYAAKGTNSDITGLTGLLGPGLTPVGAITHFPFNYAPAGFLKANGAAVAVATYGLLAAASYCGDASNPTAPFGYRCNNTDGSGRSITGTYIVLPDIRAEFIRGWDDGRGVDSGRILGSAQGFSVEAHAHGSSALAGANSRPVGGGSSESATAGSSTGSYGGSETRPRNIALLACIKY